MDVTDILDAIIAILSGLTVCIPLVFKLIETVKELVNEKKWNVLVRNVFILMSDAEERYQRGDERKEYVMSAIEIVASEIGFNYDEEAKAKVSAMVDEICDLSRVINK